MKRSLVLRNFDYWIIRKGMIVLILLSFLVAGCQPAVQAPLSTSDNTFITGPVDGAATPQPAQPTRTPERPLYAPGELVDYVAQIGDTLPALAAHFNTTEEEIRQANPFIPAAVTTMPPGMPMKIPIYYAPFWGPVFQIIPDNLFVDGPAQVGFDVFAFVTSQPGWLNSHVEYASGDNRTGAEVVRMVAENYSISPRLLLAMLEYQAGALSQPSPPDSSVAYVLGVRDPFHRGLYLQLVWAANTLNNAYYGWRNGELTTFEHLDGRLERPDPWQNAASVALQYYYSRLFSEDQYIQAVTGQGLAETYRKLFGDPWQGIPPHIPGSLEQPALHFPFEVGKVWAFTGGPHTGWGDGAPLAALDFAPGAETGGCTPSDEWVTAMAPGLVTRSEPGTVIQDLDMDGNEQTGWVIFYFHVGTEDRVQVGKELKTGDPIGHPSCEGGRATGTHVHVARRYNGEWIPAAGVLAFNIEGWVTYNGAGPYLGSMKRNTRTIVACTCADENSKVLSEGH